MTTWRPNCRQPETVRPRWTGPQHGACWARRQLRCPLGAPAVQLDHRRPIGLGRRDDERRAGIIDEDAVGFVYKSKIVAALNLGFIRRPGVGGVETQPVAQKIEAQLFRRAVRDVAPILDAPVVGGLRGLNAADG